MPHSPHLLFKRYLRVHILLIVRLVRNFHPVLYLILSLDRVFAHSQQIVTILALSTA